LISSEELKTTRITTLQNKKSLEKSTEKLSKEEVKENLAQK